MIQHYIRDPDGTIRTTTDVFAWANWYETADRKVRLDELDGGDTRVSTVFLSTDHNFGEGPPILWETMVFSHDDGGGYCERYSSEAAAIAGHERILDAVKNGLDPAESADGS